MRALLDERPATLAGARLLCVDGPGGSGKTTLAAGVAAATGAPVVHMDDLYDGWAGLEGVDGQLGTLLRPLAQGRPGAYRRYDWHAHAFAETVALPHPGPGGLVVVEGVGSGSPEVADLVTVLVWVEAPREVRLRRGLARDGEDLRAEWVAWQAREDAHHARHRTRARADLVVDGTA
ncbi:4-amino-4-deoxy-L-arabinose transferase [Nocardioides litoris]|uniref:4-amino-4-deoxy-L-arabinose transferase n=1 Tax=Nocardioides litoris TaxID=1926648 RepID=UPI001122A661|nr:4-amino-4-deoxy-L-arabinose transferase [Nocardioides litoris]